MPASISRRVHKHRTSLREAGLRPVQIWVPDVRRPGFKAECGRQARLTAAADGADRELDPLLDAALDEAVRSIPE